MQMVFVASIIVHELCLMCAFFDYCFQKSFFTKNYFLIAVINLTTRGPFYTCLVYSILLRFIIWVYCNFVFLCSIPTHTYFTLLKLSDSRACELQFGIVDCLHAGDCNLVLCDFSLMITLRL